MSKKIQVKVNGKPFDVEIDDFSGNEVSLNVNGKSYTVEFEESGSPVSQPVVKTVQPTSGAAVSAPAKVPASQPVAIAAATDSDVIVAPMPGVIMDISVKPGDKVTVKQQVCALEAMKMKNIIRSTRDGVVASVDVTEGQRVPFGAVIIRFA
jgi:glutaconyl-CoA/methylmalonyl-CoA decarboxylase subunit gamma